MPFYLQGAVDPDEGQTEKREKKDVGSSPNAAVAFVMVFLSHSFLQGFQVFRGQGQLKGQFNFSFMINSS